MKKTLILIFSLITLSATVSLAQCDKKVKFISSKTEYVDSRGTVTRTESEDALVQISKSFVSVTVNGENKGMFQIQSITCDWKSPFKEGKTFIKASGDGMNISFTVEGKDGKVTGHFIAEGREDNVIKITADKFEEDI